MDKRQKEERNNSRQKLMYKNERIGKWKIRRKKETCNPERKSVAY